MQYALENKIRFATIDRINTIHSVMKKSGSEHRHIVYANINFYYKTGPIQLITFLKDFMSLFMSMDGYGKNVKLLLLYLIIYICCRNVSHTLREI